MANPFLVLGGIAISVITAAFGVLSVPGWVNSAHNASAQNDVGTISLAEAAAVTTVGAPLELDEINDAANVAKTGVKVSYANEVEVYINGSDYIVAAKSQSSETGGVIYIRENTGPIKKVTGTTLPADWTEALAAVTP